MIKLDAMEAPSGLPHDLMSAWQARVAEAQWHRYPDGNATAVKQALRRHFGLDEGLGLILGNGSDELIQMLTLAVARPGATLLTPEPGFAIYRAAARTAGLAYRTIELDPADFSLDPERAVAAVEAEQPALLFIATPNNPTGNRFPRETLDRIADAAPGLVVIDEAYFPHADGHCLEMAGRPENVLVMRTLSKAGMAGLRLGWLVGDPAWVDALERLRMPYNINVLTQAAVAFALDHDEWWREQAAAIRDRRERAVRRLSAMGGVHVWPSEANFLLVRVADAPAVHRALKEAGILVKCLDGQHPSLAGCLRLTIGSESETDAMLGALEQVIARSR
jgi:histidinol-phosphate aminotransferase